MKRDTHIARMLGAGLGSSLAEKAVNAGYSVSSLRDATQASLYNVFNKEEAKEIREKLQRQEIPEAIIQQLVDKCDWACCLCWDLQNGEPIIIHHIVEHAKTADDSYDNLAVLCLNCHAKAHSTWRISRNPYSAKYVKARKNAFEAAILEFKAGRRAMPGREGDLSNPLSQSDIAALTDIAGFLDRPALSRPFNIEGNMEHFIGAMTDLIKALNTGIRNTREGTELNRVKSARQFSNPQWREKLLIVRDQLDQIRVRFEVGIRNGELEVSPGGDQYCFYNHDMAKEIDAMRDAIVYLLNPILDQAGIPRIHSPSDFHARGLHI